MTGGGAAFPRGRTLKAFLHSHRKAYVGKAPRSCSHSSSALQGWARLSDRPQVAAEGPTGAKTER